MSDMPLQNIEGILRESMDNSEKALKSGIELQEKTINLWKDVLRKLGSGEELQAKLEAVTAEVFPTARKQLQEVVDTLNNAGNQALSLCEKTASIYKAPTLQEAQNRLLYVTESYVAAVRDNVKIAFDANARFFASWTDLMGRLASATK